MPGTSLVRDQRLLPDEIHFDVIERGMNAGLPSLVEGDAGN